MTFALSPMLLLKAYATGVFPMAEHRHDKDVFWVDPHHRGILPLDAFHISRSLARRMRRGGYTPRLNQNFEAVLQSCAARPETWISEPIHRAYINLYRLGHAHSFEIWQDEQLVGGVYGVTIGAAFFGESMFSSVTDGSKLALAHLTDHLNRCGFRLFDTQFLTPHLASLGGREITRQTYQKLLNEALSGSADIAACPPEQDPLQVLQRNTQIS